MADEKVNVRLEIAKLESELQLTQEQIEELLKRQETLLAKKESLERQLKQQPVSSKDWASKNFKWSKDCEHLRETVFNIDQFRPLQLECINVTMSGLDCLLIMPTGGGKSLCFQLPSLLSASFTLVISPLISLMEDQLMSLKEYNIRACLLNASSDKEHVNEVHKEMISKGTKLKILYVTPEKIAKSKRFMAKLEKAYEAGNLARIIIDEVHCTSQWGNDFRPDYKILGILKRQFPNAPILGLTATATSHVIEDIKKILNLSADCVLLKSSFNRVNLFYEVRRKPSTECAVLDDISNVIKTQFCNKSGIVYCFSKKDAVAVSAGLCERSVSAAFYHADLAAETRTRVHRAWTKGDLKVIVATVAFGMGIDKPNVRFVIHHAISKSMENYYQESGRAGRDNQPAHCILYYSVFDATRQSCMVFTEQTGLENLYKMLSYCQDITSCRRSLIGRHFGERWDDNSCNNMCDNCEKLNAQSNGEKRRTNVSKEAHDVLSILKNAQGISERVTMIKLLDAWNGRGVKTLRLSSVPRPSLSAENCQRLIIHLLLEEAIREDFHFTPYTTISYLVLGHRAVHILENKKQVNFALLNENITENDNQSKKKRSKSPVISQQNKKQKCQELKISVVISDDET